MKCLIHCKSRNKVNVKPRANGRNIVGCYMLRLFAHPVACCWMLLRVVAQSLKPVKLFSQQLPTFLLFRDRRSVAQQCWIRLHSSSNIVGATNVHYAWFTKTLGCILPTMHCRSQHCRELLHPFADHCQHAHNNSQHCWRNNVGSCSVCLHAALMHSAIYCTFQKHTKSNVQKPTDVCVFRCCQSS